MLLTPPGRTTGVFEEDPSPAALGLIQAHPPNSATGSRGHRRTARPTWSEHLQGRRATGLQVLVLSAAAGCLAKARTMCSKMRARCAKRYFVSKSSRLRPRPSAPLARGPSERCSPKRTAFQERYVRSPLDANRISSRRTLSCFAQTSLAAGRATRIDSASVVWRPHTRDLRDPFVGFRGSAPR